MSKEIGESDMFLYNAGFHSKFYKVKIGTVSAQKETEPEKQETRQKVSRLTGLQHSEHSSCLLQGLHQVPEALVLEDLGPTLVDT